jgi:uncharacterized protein (DUF305 family)
MLTKPAKLTTHGVLGRLTTMVILSTLALGVAPVRADGPGRGRTAQFEIDYLQSIIDHHFAALRMTELAAGTDEIREAQITGMEGTAPTPNTTRTPIKARLDDLKTLARRNNRAQREEILTAQKFLRQWYNINYEPRIRPMNQLQIELLEQTPVGEPFDIQFMEIFSRHHFTATQRSTECLVASELEHKDLERYCRSIVEAQLADIDEMRHLLCNQYNICDYQPLAGPAGQRSRRQ